MDEIRDYTETLTPPPSWWAMGAGIVGTVFWCFAVAAPLLWAVIAASVAAVVVGSVLVRTGVKVRTDEQGLRVGSADLGWRYVGQVDVLDVEETHRLLGVDADATAYLVVRTYCRGAVRVAVDDDRDPTPYWIISTRHPAELALHLRPRSMRD